MICLVLAIVSSMLVSVVMRISEKHSPSSMGKLAVNYLMCCLLAATFTGWNRLFPAHEQLGAAIAMGAFNGLLYLGGFVLLQWNIARNGVVLPATFMKLGVLVPTLMSILVFHEQPRAAQLIGMLGAVAAILLMQGGGSREKGKGSLPELILLLLAGGGADAMSKVYEETGPSALKDQFLFYTFLAALVLCLLLCLIKKQRITLKDAVWGLAISIPNYLSSRFLLLSLQDVPAVVAFPSYSVGTIILVTLVGVTAFREKLSRRKIAAMGIILAALILLNM